MRTPAGKECPYFFGDYYRGRNIEKCNLIGEADPPRNWKPDLCKNCPVPAILLANGCKNLGVLERMRVPWPAARMIVVTSIQVTSLINYSAKDNKESFARPLDRAKLLNQFQGWGTWIRTKIHRSKVWCAAIALCPNARF